MNVYKIQPNYLIKQSFTIICLLCSFNMCMGQSPEKQNVVTGIDFSGCDLGPIKSIKFYKPDVPTDYYEAISEIDFHFITNWEFLMKNVNIESLPQGFDYFSRLDNSRFFIVVKLSSQASNTVGNTITGNLLSLSPNSPATILDQITNLELTKVAGNTNIYESKPLMIVSDNDIVDDNFDEQPTGDDPPPIDDPTIDNTDDEGIDLTIYGAIGGKLKMSYSFDNSTEEKEIAICDPSESTNDFQSLSDMEKTNDTKVKKVKLNLISLVDPVTEEPYFSKAEILNEVVNVQNTYGQVCLKFVNTDMNDFTENDIMEIIPPLMNGSYDYLDDGIDIGGFNTPETSEMALLIDEIKDTTTPNSA